MADETPPNNPLRAFSFHGRLLVISCLIFAVCGFYLTIEEELFEPGSYLLIVLALPGIGGGLALFIVGCLVFHCFGLRVWNPPRSGDEILSADENGSLAEDE
jgi:hypothetical protein